MDISYSQLRQHLKQTIDKVSAFHEPCVVISNKKRKAVLISYDDYQSLEETAYLLRSPAMAKRLLQAVIDVQQGKIVQHGLIDET